jgi:hypothetical protein
MGTDRSTLFLNRKTTNSLILTILTALSLAVSCKSVVDRQDVRPRILRDVPARNLAYRLSPDISPPADLKVDDTTDKFAAVQNDFNTPKRQNDALIRTVVSPDGRRVLALYGTADEPSSSFRIDIYSSDGQFLRNMVPPTISCVFPETVTWSPDGSVINFIAHKRLVPLPSPTPLEDTLPEPDASPVPSPSIAPSFEPVAGFSTEQIYICNRDGYDLKPLTSREGLIYFYFAWAPDGHAMVALACKEDEWNARERQYKLPAGRPRLIYPDGKERLLDDGLTEALPVWSPDSAKVVTAFDTDLAIYDAASNKPTQARLLLGEQLINASVIYEQKTVIRKAEPAKNANAKSPTASPTPTSTQPATPASFNPIVRIEWPSPERIYFQTAFVRLMPSEAINTFQRWHLLSLTAQAAVLK